MNRLICFGIALVVGLLGGLAADSPRASPGPTVAVASMTSETPLSAVELTATERQAAEIVLAADHIAQLAQRVAFNESNRIQRHRVGARTAHRMESRALPFLPRGTPSWSHRLSAART